MMNNYERKNQARVNIAQATHNISVYFFLHINYIIIYVLCTYLSGYFLGAPCEYVHLGLVLRLDWPSCQPPSTCIFLVCLGPSSILLFVPTIHVSHVHPLLKTGWLNTSTQVNNMAMLHLIYNGHTYVHHIIITIQLFLHTSSILLGRPAGPNSSRREHLSWIKICSKRFKKFHHPKVI